MESEDREITMHTKCTMHTKKTDFNLLAAWEAVHGFIIIILSGSFCVQRK